MITTVFLAALLSAQASAQQNSIIGGTEVTASDPVASSTVAVLSDDGLCSGSIIDTDLVVTAGHCLGNSMKIVFGLDSNDQGARMADVVAGEAPSDFDIGKYDRDPVPTNMDDIALLRFTGGLPAGYAPAKLLPAGLALKNGEEIVLAGYGETSVDGDAGVLKKTTVRVLDVNYSQTEVKLDTSHGTSDCHGDSGGPAFVVQNGQYYLWGVDNWGPDECNEFSVYDRIQSHGSWLSDATRRLRARPAN